MSYLALYRKYRPINFEDICGQEEIVSILKHAIKNNKLSHAYLFCGPRGTGKTTIAKIVARTINCENPVDGNACGICNNCLNYLNSNDIVEIDAASNNGVDEIRELKDKINFVPSNSKFKVYIIDEVHMLTLQAFNALLKTLEEPPSHVIFILATTEPQKIPKTIASRCQKFQFKKIEDKLIVNRLKNISLLEKIDIDNDSLYEIARLSDGGMRDAINMLDQISTYTNSIIKIDDVYAVNGSVSYDRISDLLSYLITNNKIEIINFFDEIEKDGKETNRFLEEFIIFIKDIIIFKNTGILSNIDVKNDNIKKISEKYKEKDLYSLIKLISEIQNEIKISLHGNILLLITLLNYSEETFNSSDNISREILSSSIEEKVLENKIKNQNISEVQNKNKKISKKILLNNSLATASKTKLNIMQEKWNEIDNYLSDFEFSLIAGLLKDTKLVVASNKYLIIEVNYNSMLDRLEENLDNVVKLMQRIYNETYVIILLSSKEWQDTKLKYIEDLKKGKKYKEIITTDESQKRENSILKLENIVGSDLIEYI